MNYQGLMQMMQFISQFKNGNANQQINQLISSGKVTNDMLNQAHQAAKPIYDALKGLQR